MLIRYKLLVNNYIREAESHRSKTQEYNMLHLPTEMA